MLSILFSTILLHLLRPVSPAALPSPFALQKRAPEQVYGLGLFAAEAAGSPLVALDNGMQFYFQNSDSNAVVYVNGVARWYSAVHEDAGCDNGNNCFLAFQQDGNFVSYYNGVATWNTHTAGIGQYLAFFDKEPYIVIYNAALTPVWTSSGGNAPKATGSYNYCENGAEECVGLDPAPSSYTFLEFDFGGGD